MALGVDGVEVDELDRLGARGLHLRDGVVTARVVGQGGQHDARRRVAQVPLADRQPDLGGAAEQQDGLGVAYGVEHHLEQLQASGHVGGEHPVGIHLAAHGDPLVDARVHGVEGFGGGAGVLGGVEPAAEFQYPPVEFGDELVQAGLDREVDADVPARDREAQRRLVARCRTA